MNYGNLNSREMAFAISRREVTQTQTLLLCRARHWVTSNCCKPRWSSVSKHFHTYLAASASHWWCPERSGRSTRAMPWCCLPPSPEVTRVTSQLLCDSALGLCAASGSRFSAQAVTEPDRVHLVLSACLVNSSLLQQCQSAVLTHSSSPGDDGVKWILYVCSECVCTPTSPENFASGDGKASCSACTAICCWIRGGSSSFAALCSPLPLKQTQRWASKFTLSSCLHWKRLCQKMGRREPVSGDWLGNKKL